MIGFYEGQEGHSSEFFKSMLDVRFIYVIAVSVPFKGMFNK